MLRGPVVQVESVLLDTDSGERLLTTFGLLTLDHWPNLQRQIGQREQTLQARAILQAHCYRCHHGRAPQEGGFDVLETANLLAPRPGGAIVVPGDLERSPLWRRLGREQSMPPQEISRRPSPAEMKTIQRWLEAGSLSWSQETAGRQPIPLQKVLRAIRAHLVQANRTDQPYLRYFTLAHLYNNPRLPETDLNVQRAALAKTINSLSWKPRLVLPTQVDVDGTVYAIDLRDLGWEPQRHWQALMGAYPYGLALDRHVDGEVQQLYQEIVAQSSCRLAFVRADWFVARASQPPLYYTLLGLPAASTKLDERLGIDLPGAFQQGRLVRSGFMQSRLSGQNRLVERCDTPHGALWRSYDFRKDGEKNNLARFPLGPVFPRHPHPALAFVHDVSAVLFHLPNGLMAYLLADGQGRRLDEAPVEVFHDALRTSGQVKVTAGLSCIACHSSGIKLLPGDALREGAAIFGRARDKLQRLHPDKAQVDELLQQDEVHFMRAAEKVAGPYLWTLAGPDTPFRNLPEPVGECSRLYNLDGLDLNMTAWELGLADPGPLRARIQSDPALKALGLGILLLEGGRIPRSDWEKEAFSLMQRVARSLKLGLPLREANPIP
jgi:serine/threonine-protein kinase